MTDALEPAHFISSGDSPALDAEAMFEVEAVFFPTTGFSKVALTMCVEMDSKNEEPAIDPAWGSGKLLGLPREGA